MRLFRVELNRYFARRAIALLLLAAALVTGVAVAKTIWDTRPATAAELSTAQAQSALMVDDPNLKAELTECQKDPASYLGPSALFSDCHKTLVPSASSFLPRHSLSLSQVLHGDGIRIMVALAAVMVLVAATYAGADWGSDSISTQLTFEPRRARVWLTKGAVVALVSGLVSAAILLGYGAALWITADARGLTIPDGLSGDAGWQLLRGVSLAMAAGLGSYALTMLFRHTVATLGLLFAYAAGGEVLINLVPIHGAARWSVGNNVYGWLKSGFSYADPSAGCKPFSNCNAVHSLGHAEAAWFLAALLAVAVAGSLVSFLRRDV